MVLRKIRVSVVDNEVADVCKVKIMFYYTEKKNLSINNLNTFICSAKFQTYGDVATQRE